MDYSMVKRRWSVVYYVTPWFSVGGLLSMGNLYGLCYIHEQAIYGTIANGVYIPGFISANTVLDWASL